MNISIKRNNDKNFRITVKKDGVAYDITGWTVYFTVKKNASDADDKAIISKTVTTHEDATNGITNIAIAANDTKTKPVGYYVFDIKVKDAQNKLQSSETGAFELVQEVTDGGA